MSRLIGKSLFGVLALSGVLGLASPAHATFVVQTGNNPQTGDSNVISNACSGTITGPAFTVQGCLNDDHSTIVNFTSDENITYTGGQATIKAQDGAFSTLTIALASGMTFQSLILNIDGTKFPKPPKGMPPTVAQVTFSASPGSPPTYTFDLDSNGQNFFTITPTLMTGLPFNSIKFTTNVAMSEFDAATSVSQVRLGPSTTTAVPEPGSLALVGVGLLGLCLVLRGRSRSTLSEFSAAALG